MTRTLVALAAVFCAFTASAEFTFDPPAPASHTSVMLRVRHFAPLGCEPRNETVKRVGNTIDVQWFVGDCITIGFSAPWVDAVPLGVLEPGLYTVRLFVDNDQIHSTTLLVTLGDPPFLLSPPYADLHGGTRIVLFHAHDYDTRRITRVRLGGVEVATQPVPGEGVSFIAPAHAAGAVDVEVETDAGTVSLPLALRYLDPAAPVDSSVFERVLLPVIYNGAGAFGSQWVTEGAFESDLGAFDWFHAFERAACDGQCSKPPQFTDFSNHASGLMVSVPRQFADHIRFAPLRVRDVSRNASSYGAEVPVVREHEFQDELVFANVPFDPRYRLMLRLYSMSGVTRHWSLALGSARSVVQLNGPCPSTPCASAIPAFAQVDLGLALPQASGSVTVRIENSLDPKWGFITVTNNETQEVTVISPMR